MGNNKIKIVRPKPVETEELEDSSFQDIAFASYNTPENKTASNKPVLPPQKDNKPLPNTPVPLQSTDQKVLSEKQETMKANEQPVLIDQAEEIKIPVEGKKDPLETAQKKKEAEVLLEQQKGPVEKAPLEETVKPQPEAKEEKETGQQKEKEDTISQEIEAAKKEEAPPEEVVEVEVEEKEEKKEEETPKEEPKAKTTERLTDMKEPALDGGPEKLFAENETILKATEETIKTASEEAFAKDQDKILTLGKNEKKKDNAPVKLKKTINAVEEKPEEKKSEVNSKQVEKMTEVKPPEVKGDDAQKNLLKGLEESITTLKDLDEIKENGKAEKIAQQVQQTVQGETNEVSGTFNQIGTTEKPAAPKKGVPLGEIEKAVPTANLELGKSLIPEVPQEALNLDSFVEESDNLLKKEGLSEEHLEMVDSGDLMEAKKIRSEINTKATEQPEAVKKEEQKLKASATADLKKQEAVSRKKMEAERQSGLRTAQAKQKGTKSAFEKKKEEVTNHINGIYETANKEVQGILGNLQQQAMARFKEKEEEATTAFVENVKRRTDEFKDEQSFLDKLVNLFTPINEMPEVKLIFTEEKASYIQKLDQAIASIIADSKATIDQCKDIIAKARTKIKEFVLTLKPSLRKTGEDAMSDISKKLDELDQKVNKAAEELQAALAAKRKEAIEKIDQKIEEMREEMGGFLGKAAAFLLDAAIKFFRWALQKAGVNLDDIMPVINKGKAVLTSVVSDPEQFMKNLGAGVGGGINRFVDNIGTHLKTGLFDWLTGAMSSVPITLPEKWDLKGIFSLLAQLLGFGWDDIKDKLGKRVGDDKVGQIENAIEKGEEGLKEVEVVRKEGVAGAINIVKDQVETVKETAMEEVINWAIMAIVKAAIPRIILMLNPVGAIAQIILAIYNAIVWFVNNIDRIINWVKAVFDSVVSIAKGAIDVAATKVEESMARAIPIILAFLAQQLNLGNVAEGITKAIKKIREPIDKLVNKVVDWIAEKAKKLLNKLFKKKPGAANRPEDKRTPQEKQQALNKGVKEGTDYVKAGGKTRKQVDKKLKELEDTYQLTDLHLVVDKDNETGADLVHVHGEVNPTLDGKTEEFKEEDNTNLLLVGKHDLPAKAKGRESHHVPANQLAIELGRFYKAIGDKIVAEVPSGSIFGKLGIDLVNRGKTISTTYKAKGTGLSAIALSVAAHTAAETGLHSKEMQGEAYDTIINNIPNNKLHVVAFEKNEERLLAKMQSEHWQAFLAQIYNIEKINAGDEEKGLIHLDTYEKTENEFIIKLKGGDKEANDKVATDIVKRINDNKENSNEDKAMEKEEKGIIVNLINNTSEQAYETAFTNGINSVRAGLKNSTDDGTKQQQNTAINALKDEADRIWYEILIKPFDK